MINTPVRGNSIYGNSQEGIELNNDGVTLNDVGDLDSGPNWRQNFPVLTAALAGTGEITITGGLNSEASRVFEVDLYATSSPAASGYGQGETYLGSATLTTDATGNGDFSATLSWDWSDGSFVSATATDSAGNTSEFGFTIPVVQPDTTIYRATAAPVIDGVMENTWRGSVAHDILRVSWGSVSDEADLSGSWRALWDPGGLYFFIEVADDVLKSDSAPAFAWNDDTIEIFIDADFSHGTQYDDYDDLQLGFHRGDLSVYMGSESIQNTDGVVWSLQSASSSYVLEVYIPTPWLVNAGSAADGDIIGVDVQIDDDDDASADRDGKISWHAPSDNAYHDASLLGSARLAAADFTTASGLWMSTESDVTGGGLPTATPLPPLDSWTEGEVLQFADPDLALWPGTSGGSFSTVFDLDAFAADGNSDIYGLHFVTRDIRVGNATFFEDLQEGDLLLTTKDDEILGGLSVTRGEVVLFHPTAGDYGAGTFTLLLDDFASLHGGGETLGLTLVEQDTQVGDVLLTEGSFLFSRDGGSEDNDIYWYQPDGVGAGHTDGAVSVLIEGDDLGIGPKIYGMELVEQATGIANVSMPAGAILVTLDGTDSDVGVGLEVTKWDMAYLTVTRTTSPTVTASGAVTVLMEGLDVALNDANENLDALSLIPSTINHVPIANTGGPYTISEGESLTLDASGSADPNADTLTYLWDIDNNGSYGDVTGEILTLDWATLDTFGIRDGAATGTDYTIGLQVDDGRGGVSTVSTTLTVNNAAPTLTATGPATVFGGTAYTLNLSASDYGDDAITDWTINWGDGTIDTLAGNPPSVTHTYAQAGFTRNITVSATDEDGTWTSSELIVGNWVVGSENVRRFDGSTGAFDSSFATSSGELNRPYSAIVGPDGNFYVSGYNSDNVVRFDSAGNYLGEFVTSGSGGLNQPCGLAFGPDGNLYVADFGGNSVLRFNGATGAFIDVFGSGGALNGPSGIAWGPDGDLYVSSWGNGKIFRFDGVLGGAPTTEINSGLASPEQLAFDDSGNLYIADGPNNAVKKWDGASLTTYFSHASLDYATGLTFGPDGWMYVSSYDDDQIVRYDGSTTEIFVTAVSGGLDQPEYLSFTPAHQVTVTPNSPPTITSSTSPSIDENLTVVQLLTATDPELEAVTFAVTGGDDGGLFTIDGSNQLAFLAAPDFETPSDFDTDNVYDVEVTAEDSFGNATAYMISVSVNPVDDNSPSFTSPAAVNVSENTTFVQSVIATDADLPAQTLAYSISGGADSGFFTIDGATGDLSFVAAPDFEAPADFDGDRVYEVAVDVSDGAGGTDLQIITVTVTDADEGGASAISDTNAAADFVLENAAAGTAVGVTALADDPDGTDSISYSLDDDAGGRFSINSSSGVVTVAGTLDRETANSYDVTVRATSTDTTTTTRTFTIALGDVDEFDVGAVTDSDATSNAVNENAAIGTAVGVTAAASDADATNNTITYWLDDDAGGQFAIDATTGVVTLNGALDYETASSYSVILLRRQQRWVEFHTELHD